MTPRAGAWDPRGIGTRFLLLGVLFAVVCLVALRVPGAAYAETCDQDGIHVSFTTVYSTAPPAGYKVTAIKLSGIDAICKGRDVTITLKNGSTTIASVHTVISGDSITIPLSTPAPVDSIGDVDIEIAAGTPTPSETPSPTPSPSPTPTESPTPTPSPTPTASPAPPPTAQPSPLPVVPVVPTLPATTSLPPTLSPTPGPSPTSTGTPQPTPTPPLTAPTSAPPPAAGPAEPTSTPAPPNEARSSFAEFVPSLRNISTSPATIATNVTLSLVAFLLIVMACAVFNETLEENGPVLTGMLMTALGPLRGLFFRPPPAAIVKRATALSLLKPVFLLALIGFIYSALDPDFGWNLTTLALLISLSLGLGFLTFFYEGGKVLVSARIYHGTGTLRIQPLGVAVAILSVVVSRIIAIHPGIVFGFVAGAAVSGNDEREDGQITYLPMVALFIMSMVAFVLIDPLRSFSDNSAQWYGVIPETVAVTLFIGGIEGLLFNLLPLEFMEGKEVWNWSRFAWLTIALPVGFVFFHLLVNRSDAYESSLQETSVQVLFAACGVFLVLSFGFWLACRFWLPKHSGAAAEGSH